jgi:hypothetical protein
LEEIMTTTIADTFTCRFCDFTGGIDELREHQGGLVDCGPHGPLFLIGWGGELDGVHTLNDYQLAEHVRQGHYSDLVGYRYFAWLETQGAAFQAHAATLVAVDNPDMDDAGYLHPRFILRDDKTGETVFSFTVKIDGWA